MKEEAQDPVVPKMEVIPTSSAKRAHSVPKRVHFADKPIIIQPKQKTTYIPRNFVVYDLPEETEEEEQETEEKESTPKEAPRRNVWLLAFGIILIAWVVIEEADMFRKESCIQKTSQLTANPYMNIPIEQLVKESRSIDYISMLNNIRRYIPAVIGIFLIILFVK